MVYKELTPPPVVLQYYYGIDLLVIQTRVPISAGRAASDTNS
jgi:hypothetical protein